MAGSDVESPGGSRVSPAYGWPPSSPRDGGIAPVAQPCPASDHSTGNSQSMSPTLLLPARRPQRTSPNLGSNPRHTSKKQRTSPTQPIIQASQYLLASPTQVVRESQTLLVMKDRVKWTHPLWYLPNIHRKEACQLLFDKEQGVSTLSKINKISISGNTV